jgi:hypothetical protein
MNNHQRLRVSAFSFFKNFTIIDFVPYWIRIKVLVKVTLYNFIGNFKTQRKQIEKRNYSKILIKRESKTHFKKKTRRIENPMSKYKNYIQSKIFKRVHFFETKKIIILLQLIYLFFYQ